MFFTGCPKSAVRGDKTKLKINHRASAKKCWVKSQICRNGLPEDFWAEGKKALDLLTRLIASDL